MRARAMERAAMTKALAVFALLAPSLAVFEHVQQKSIADAASDPSYSLRGAQKKCDPADADLHIVFSTGSRPCTKSTRS